MKNRMLTSSEVMHIQHNLRLIERKLGHTIPPGTIDVSELKEHLSSYEIDHICNNIRQIENYNKISNHSNHISSHDDLEMIIGFAILGFGFLLWFLSSVFGIRIF